MRRALQNRPQNEDSRVCGGLTPQPWPPLALLPGSSAVIDPGPVRRLHLPRASPGGRGGRKYQRLQVCPGAWRPLDARGQLCTWERTASLPQGSLPSRRRGSGNVPSTLGRQRRRRVWGPDWALGDRGDRRRQVREGAGLRVERVHVVGVWLFHSNFGSLGSGRQRRRGQSES